MLVVMMMVMTRRGRKQMLIPESSSHCDTEREAQIDDPVMLGTALVPLRQLIQCSVHC